jgi:hypothetical protein
MPSPVSLQASRMLYVRVRNPEQQADIFQRYITG